MMHHFAYDAIGEMTLGSRYRSLAEAVTDLEKNGHLFRVTKEVDPYLELAEIQRRLYRSGGPAVLFENVNGSSFPCLANLYGSEDRMIFLFRDTIEQVQTAISLKMDPPKFLRDMLKGLLRNPLHYLKVPFTGLTSLPRKTVPTSAPVLEQTCKISDLPQIVSWPKDGGAFITLPQVLSTTPADKPNVMTSNLGMYRVQLSGNDYVTNREVGLHYQIHRGLGIHHQQALAAGKDLPVSIFVGGPPSHTFSAVMPLPEGLSELIFAGMLGGRRFPYCIVGEHVVSAEADFCITGWLKGAATKPEGPFGDHLGYYSLTHDFPVLQIENVHHRKDAIWPFTVVGRPPQEDTEFGGFIHKLTGNVVPYEIPGVKSLHAVDASGVHPLLFAVGSERYTPYTESRPQEILTQAHAILGFNQCSLAKYLFMATDNADSRPDVHSVQDFFIHMLERVDFTRDLHFQTKTTIDTLDYSGDGLNEGSKLILAASAKKIRDLECTVPKGLESLSDLSKCQSPVPGVLAVQCRNFQDYAADSKYVESLIQQLEHCVEKWNGIAIIVLTEDADFISANIGNFVWATFTRSNPSHDIYGIQSFYEHKHWGCKGPLIIDARIKPHHAPELIEDVDVSKRVDAWAAKKDTPISKFL